MRKLGLIIATIITVAFMQGCTSTKNEVEPAKEVKAPKKVEKKLVVSNSKYYSINTSTTSTLEDTVNEIAIQLLDTMKIKPNLEAIALTSFVDLHQLNKTTYFGRVMAESFFNELHSRGFTVADFRGQKNLIVNADGEFFISRDVKKLSAKVTTKYVLVGTYAKVEEGVIINARIVDNQSGVVVASSRVVHHSLSCEIFENCKKEQMNKKVVATGTGKVEKRTIGLSTDGCSSVQCPRNCTTLDCYESRSMKNVWDTKSQTRGKCKKTYKNSKSCNYK